jgi:pyruvate formate lyase activating enzyme
METRCPPPPHLDRSTQREEGQNATERTGMVFDIREFTVHDGPGMRTTVFLKGCPMRCAWCHNPEGLSPQPQTLRSPVGVRTAGRLYRVGELAERLNRQAPILRDAGGVTFSGGEPLLQARFVAEVIQRLDRIHVAVETCGYGCAADFRQMTQHADLVLFGLKLADPSEHARWTGVDNAPILQNLRLLSHSGRPFVIRIPLVPGVTDTEENLRGIAREVRQLNGLLGVELLPYNRAAGAKYASCGLNWCPGYDESQAPSADLTCFSDCGVEARIL